MGGVALWLVLACAGAGARAGAGAGRGLADAQAEFALETTLQLNDAARVDREVGYKLRAQLAVAPRWADSADYLLEFRLRSPKLYLRGKHVNADFMPYESLWDSYSDSTFYAHWSHGELKAAYLDSSEPPDVLNYKKSLISLFQVQLSDGEYNETDVSGSCLVLYETISSEVFRKIKVRCAEEAGGAGGAGGASALCGARRVARYSRDGAGLRALHAEELLEVGARALGLKARSWHSLERAAGAGGAGGAPTAASLRAALGALPAALAPHTLALHAPPDDDDEELAGALAGGEAALAEGGAGRGGGARGAAAALRLLPALRRAAAPALLALLQRAAPDQLEGLCRLLGLAGTRAALAAADDFLQLAARDPLLPPARAYLAAFALAPRPDEAAVRELLRLGEEAREPAVRAAALLGAAAAARALPAAAQAARDALARGLARCRDAPCRALRLRALGSLRRADTADLLLEHAERADAAALAALGALDAAPAAALTFARLDRLQALALRDAAPLELRAAAVDLLVRRRADVPAPLARLAHELHARGAHELRRVLWQRLGAQAARHEALRALPAQLEPELRGWDAQAHGGTSSVLARAPGWELGGWRAELQSVQVAQGGLLRRGEVRLLAHDEHNNTFDALTVEVWTRGLEAFGGGGGDSGEEPAGGLALSVGGARLPELALFQGQAELLAHVWAGSASAPTPVLRALLPLHEARAAPPLLAGVRLRARAAAALALALDAQAQVSLWWRSAHAELQLRAGLAAQARLRVRTAWAELDAAADVRAEPRLRIASDLDFYSGVALCARVSTEPHELARTVALQARGGARRLRVRRRREARTPLPGRTLALGRPNDATCRTLRAGQAAPDDPDAD